MLSFIGFLLMIESILNFAFDLADMDESELFLSLKERNNGFLKARIKWIALSILDGLLFPIILLATYHLTRWALIPILNFCLSLKDIPTTTLLVSTFLLLFIEGISKKTPFRSFLVVLPLYFLFLVYMTKVSILEFFFCTFIYIIISGTIDLLKI
ncbi:hypothetical protein H5T58_03725 [Candidatus Parcubacteria bacterium]|nr:hypothetical protein [Candidatus Parcubacteria bacterium]